MYWGTYSLVEAELACLADLLAVPGWKFALNLAGSELMLATNRCNLLGIDKDAFNAYKHIKNSN